MLFYVHILYHYMCDAGQYRHCQEYCGDRSTMPDKQSKKEEENKTTNIKKNVQTKILIKVIY